MVRVRLTGLTYKRIQLVFLISIVITIIIIAILNDFLE